MLLSGCTAPSTWRAIGDVPADIAYLAVVSLDEDGALVTASGLLARESSSTLFSLIEPEVTLSVVGWTEAELAKTIAGVDAATLASTRLERADSTDPVLPVASYRASGTVGDTEAQLSTALPKTFDLTAPWVPRCPVLVEGTADGDLRCPACRVSVTQDACRLSFTPAGCGVLTLDATVEARGTIRFDRPELLKTCESVTSTGSKRFDCERPDGSSCTLDLYEGDAPPSFDVASVAPLGAQELIANPGGRQEDRPVRGYFAGLVDVPDGAVVAVYEAGGEWKCPVDVLSPNKRSSLVFIGRDAPLRVVGTATAPPCLTHIVPDQAGFLGVFGDTTQRIGRFDAQGRLLESAPIPQIPGPPSFVVRMLLSADRRRVGLVLLDPSTVRAVTFLAVFDVATLSQLFPLVGLSDQAYATATVGPDLFVSFESDDAGSATIDAAGMRTLIPSRDRQCGLPTMGISSLGIAQATTVSTGRVLLSARAFSPALLWVDAARASCKPIALFDEGLEPYATVSLGAGSAAYGGTSITGDAFVGLLDVGDERIIRGATKVGKGIVSQLVAGSQGEIWAVLTGEAKVARLTRR